MFVMKKKARLEIVAGMYFRYGSTIYKVLDINYGMAGYAYCPDLSKDKLIIFRGKEGISVDNLLVSILDKVYMLVPEDSEDIPPRLRRLK